MSLFTRTAAQVDALEASVNSLSASSNPIDIRKQSLTDAQQSFATIQPTVNKFVTKANLGESDPNKRLYGAAMVTKIRSLDQRLTTISENLTSLEESIDPQYAQFQSLREQEEAQRKAAEEEALRVEEQRKADQLRAQQEENARIEREKIERENALKRQREAEEKARLEREAEEKKRAEQEAIAKQHREAEQLAATATLQAEKEKADEEKRAADAKERIQASNACIKLTFKTTRGRVVTVKNVPANSSVADLKHLIETQSSIPAESQRLIFQGRLLSDAKKIDTYKISDGSAIHLVENRRAAASSSRAAPTPLLVAPGTVCHVENGKEQFDSILDNCGKHRLTVVDWSAPWCGPCRMIAPVFERLATRFSDVTFVKVDTEASPGNTMLASEKGITAYPSFHFYIDSRLVHNFMGANASGIEAGIRKCRPMVVAPDGASSSAARTSAGPSASGALTRRVLGALTTLKNNCDQQEFLVAVRTLLVFVRNIVSNPGQEKYRKVRSGNSTFQNRLASRTGGMECMRAFGFEETTENGMPFLVLSAEAAANPELATIKTQLEQAVAVASGSLANQPQPTSNTESPGQQMPNPPSGLPFGNLPTGMPAGMDNDAYRSMMMEMMADPGFMQVASELAADPTAVESLMQLQRAMESGDPTAVQQLQSNPSLARLQTAIASNPAVLNTMMRRMAGAGFPGMPGMPGMTNNQNPAGNAAPTATQPTTTTNAYPGAPTTADEEERLLQEAIRLSMQENGPSQEQGSKGDDENQQNKEG